MKPQWMTLWIRSSWSLCCAKTLSSDTFSTSIEVCQTSGFQTWLANFSFQMHAVTICCTLFVVYSSGVSRAALSCSLRPSARSLSSQTSSLSPPISMSCMSKPKLSAEDRCVCRARIHPHHSVSAASGWKPWHQHHWTKMDDKKLPYMEARTGEQLVCRVVWCVLTLEERWWWKHYSWRAQVVFIVIFRSDFC